MCLLDYHEGAAGMTNTVLYVNTVSTGGRIATSLTNFELKMSELIQ